MITSVSQRWRNGRTRFRPAHETINPREYEVVPLVADSVAKAFICSHHYAGSMPPAKEKFGLYRRDQLVGVAVFSVPCNPRSITNVFGPIEPDIACELGRFVILDSIPGNAESWMLARCFEVMRRLGYAALITFADPVPRANLNGALIFNGHCGTIYQATNFVLLPRSTPRTLRLLPNGHVLSDRAISKIRKGERGWRYASQLLAQHGAPPAPANVDARKAWLAYWLKTLTRGLSHGGNYKYALALDRKLRKRLPPSLPYPRFIPPPATTLL